MAEQVKAENQVSSVGIHKGVRVLKVQTVLAEFKDRDGATKTKIAFILGDTVHFLNDDAALTGEVNKQLADSIITAAGLK